jgi:hypothetical protein
MDEPLTLYENEKVFNNVSNNFFRSKSSIGVVLARFSLYAWAGGVARKNRVIPQERLNQTIVEQTGAPIYF